MIVAKAFIKYFGINSSNQLNFFVDYDGATNLSKTTTGTITYNLWTHVCITWSGGSSSSDVTIYMNGSSVAATGTNGAGSAVSDAASGFWIGNSDNNTARTFDGIIDEVRIYNRELSAPEVKQLYDMGR
jgi:hypothetical protein